MTDAKKSSFINGILGGLGTLIVTVVVGLIVFYFSTENAIAQIKIDVSKNGVELLDIKTNVLKVRTNITELKGTPALNKQKIEGIEKDVDRIEENQGKMVDKLDKIMVLLVEIKRK